jgi:hypothetical protein
MFATITHYAAFDTRAAEISASVQQTSAADEIEWAQLEASRPSFWEQCEGPKVNRETPHPLSYGAKLPMRGLGLGESKPTHKRTLTAAEKKAVTSVTYAASAPKPVIRASSPHPDSYRADLPLRSELSARKTKKWTLTAAEKTSLATRPLRYTR